MAGEGLDAKVVRELVGSVPRINRFRTVDELDGALVRELAL